tara:strand:- start:59 stop:469 length:411 start_codon:yes stop_codon:yes gene_type:complete
MKKNDLKKIIKPLVKECIHEVLLEEGLLSNVVAEVAKGMQGSLMVESQQAPVESRKIRSQQTEATRAKLRQHRKKLMDSIGADAYNGVDLFEGTTPTRKQQAAPAKGSADLGDPSDSGVDISSLIGNASHVWKAIK